MCKRVHWWYSAYLQLFHFVNCMASQRWVLQSTYVISWPQLQTSEIFLFFPPSLWVLLDSMQTNSVENEQFGFIQLVQVVIGMTVTKRSALWSWLQCRCSRVCRKGGLRAVGWIPHTMPSLCGWGGEAGVLAASAVSESLVSCSGHLKDGIPLLMVLPGLLAWKFGGQQRCLEQFHGRRQRSI